MSQEYVNLPVGWTRASIGQVTQPNVDQGGPSGSAEFLYVDIGSIDNKAKRITNLNTLFVTDAPSRARQRLEPNDVLVSMTRPNLNAVAMLSEGMAGAIGSTGFDVLRTILISPSWLYYISQTEAFVEAMSRIVQGALYPAVRPKDIRGHLIPLAPLPEQHRIVAEIDKHFTRLDNVVIALQRVRASLKRYRAAVLKAACEGRLVPTEAELAKQEGRDYEPADVLLKHILRERRTKWEADQLSKMRKRGKEPKDDHWKAAYEEPAGLNADELPEVPQGWGWATTGQAVSRSEYGTSVKCSYEASGIGVLRIPNIAAGEVSLTDMKFATQTLQLDQQDMLQVGDLLMCRTNGSIGLIGKTALVRSPLSPPRTFASYLLRFRLVETSVLPKWIHLYTASPQGRAFIERNAASSAGQHNISLTLIHSMPFPLPPLAEQHRIVAEVERRFSVVETLEQAVEANLQRAARLRQSILKRAFEGKLVPQDLNDEPASVLLERIKGERSGTSPTRQGSALRCEETVRPRSKTQQVQMPL